METITSQKGKPIVLHEGYRYRKDRDNVDGSISWRCIHRHCSGRLKQLPDDTADVTVTPVHSNHAPNPMLNIAERIKAAIHNRAADTAERPRRIIQECTAGERIEATQLLPSYTASQRTIERKRKRLDVVMPNPPSVAEIDLPDALLQTTRNENFVLWDSGSDDVRRIFMFGTE